MITNVTQISTCSNDLKIDDTLIFFLKSASFCRYDDTDSNIFSLRPKREIEMIHIDDALPEVISMDKFDYIFSEMYKGF